MGCLIPWIFILPLLIYYTISTLLADRKRNRNRDKVKEYYRFGQIKFSKDTRLFPINYTTKQNPLNMWKQNLYQGSGFLVINSKSLILYIEDHGDFKKISLKWYDFDMDWVGRDKFIGPITWIRLYFENDEYDITAEPGFIKITSEKKTRDIFNVLSEYRREIR